MKNGALSAATEYNVNVTFEGPENEEDYNAQNKMIENAVSNNVGVIILSAIDFEKNADAVQKAINSGIKVITVDSDVDVNDKELLWVQTILKPEKSGKASSRFVQRAKVY